ncbi:tRNA 2-selenouridine(34) synthase MnmH [Salisediminibacterium beveridgei]|uniref:Selenophosphate-dependent tRNA 2-selenouridine synthase n=1 Tax=Salisediminibacterium beveridgei TaxID=632773 RepID=A0A1D7QVR3_9BACI|nr:tRNA 2-selenouridine(34) synthase MnmH [Salisediminibacterium beveridgei]AOM83095.1 Selenophosphate-dependent tRNA 2-selenouridine synthase [Salisediminibacterium beveridgei]
MHQHQSYMKYYYDELDLSKQVLVDVRSPAEFAEFHHPDSISIPLFSNEERERVGTIYKQIGQEKAKEEGVKILSGKLTTLYNEFQSILDTYPDRELILSCARGGMRSGILVSFLKSLQFPAGQLEGGVRSIRKYVQSELKRLSEVSWQTIVLGGHTGTGKTKWLLELQEQGYPVLDLEGLAAHRGSVFGHIGKDPSTQKQFEWNLVWDLQKLEKDKMLILEAESKRIGRITLPEFIMNAKDNGHVIEMYDDLKRRVANIMEDYQPDSFSERIAEAYKVIRKRLDDGHRLQADADIEKQEYESLFAILLEHYYDPRYRFSQGNSAKGKHYQFLNIQHTSEHLITDQIKQVIDQWWERQPMTHK